MFIVQIECQLDGHLRPPPRFVWRPFSDKKRFNYVKRIEPSLSQILQCTLGYFSEQSIWIAGSHLKPPRELP